MFSAVSFKQASFNPTSFKYDTITPVTDGRGLLYPILRRRRRV